MDLNLSLNALGDDEGRVLLEAARHSGSLLSLGVQGCGLGEELEEKVRKAVLAAPPGPDDMTWGERRIVAGE